MKGKTINHDGSSFDDFLEEQGIADEVDARAVKAVLALQLEQSMREQGKSKMIVAKEIGTSRSQLDRLLDPNNTAVSLETITRAARVLGKRVSIRVYDAADLAKRRKTSRGQEPPAKIDPLG